MIGEYKSSLKEIDVDDKVWRTFQPFVYQYAAGILWPEYTLTAVQYTLLSPQKVERVIRPMWPSDMRMWKALLIRKAVEMSDIKKYDFPFPNYSWNCKFCPFWQGTCQRNLLLGG